MKKALLTFLAISQCFLFSQNITGTLGNGGIFKIKDAGNNDFLTLSQLNGNLTLLRNLDLGPDTSAFNHRGVITKGGKRFLHNYQDPNTAGFNLFLGLYSGNFTLGSPSPLEASYNTGVGFATLTSLTTGYSNSAFGFRSLWLNTTGYRNSAYGVQSLMANTTGYNNCAFGFRSLFTNTLGNSNCAFGFSSLYYNTTGNFNSAYGNNSLFNNTTGYGNSAFGSEVLYSNSTGYRNSGFGTLSLNYNTTGFDNSAFGYWCMSYNTTGSGNSAFGVGSLYNNMTGYGNSAFGYWALYRTTAGNYNVAVGDSAGANISGGSNNIAIGYNALVPNPTSDNQIRLGNTSITYAGIQVPWTITSDKRYKYNISPLGLGLNFVTKLNPVSYTRKNDDSKKIEFGLIAQEVEQVLNDIGIDNHSMITVTSDGMYELRYNDLIAPMIKAIQELKDELISKQREISILKEQYELEINSLKDENKYIKSEIIAIKNELVKINNQKPQNTIHNNY